MATVLSYTEVLRPYPGLRPFDQHEAEIFFGRDTHVDRLLEILQQQRFLAVIGPSGCGKSSLVRAGLLPGVAAGWLGTGSDWHIVVIRPGDRPVRELARSLCAQNVFGAECGPEEDAGLIELELARGRRGLIDVFQLAVRRAESPRRLNLLVVVDQFEELFTYAREGTPQADESGDFVNLLIAAANEPDTCIHVVLTMRTDFLGSCVRFLNLPDAINRGMYLTPRLNRDEMRDAIAGPAALFGGSVDEQLAGQLINGVGGDSDELPILQHALSRVWRQAQETRHSTAMIPKDLSDIGGLDKALSAHADAVCDKLPAELQPLMKKLFQFITERTSPEDGSRDVRRARPLSEIACSIAGCTWTTLAPIVEAFAADGVNFLTYTSSDDEENRIDISHEDPIRRWLGPESIIDISHEALIRKWDRLQKWVSQEAGRATGYRRWHERAASGALLTGAELTQAVRWRDGGDEGEPPDPTWAARYGSSREFDATLEYIAESERDRRRRQRAKKWRRLSLAFGVIAAIGLLGLATVSRWRAEAEKAQIESYLRARYEEVRSNGLKFKLDAAETQRALDEKQHELFEQQQAGQRTELMRAQALARTRLLETEKAEEALKTLKAQQLARAAQTETQQVKARQLMSESQIYAKDDPERSQLLALEAHRMLPFPESDSMIRAVRWRYGSLLHTLRGAGAVSRTSFSPDGKTILVLRAGEENVAEIWDAGSARLLVTLTDVDDAAFDARGTRLATSSGRMVRVWDVTARRSLATFTHGNTVHSMAFSPDGRYVAAAIADKTVPVNHVETRKPAFTLTGHTAVLTDVAYSPDGKMIATASRDKTIRVWNASDGTPLQSLKPSDFARAIVFSNDSKKLLSVNGENVLQILNPRTGDPIGAPLTGHVGDVTRAAFHPKDTVIVTGSEDGSARSWDAVTGLPLRTLIASGNGPVRDVSFDREGDTVLVASDDGTARWLGVAGGELLAVFDAHHGSVSSAAISPDGRTVVTAHDDGARLWDAGAGRPVMTLAVEGSGLPSATFARDGANAVIVSGLNEVVVRDTASWSARPTQKREGWIAAISDDGNEMLEITDGGKVLLLDTVTGRILAALQFEGFVAGGRFSRDGNRVLVAGGATVWVRETRGGKLLATLRGHRLDITDGYFSPDGSMVVTASEDGTSRLWAVADGRLVRILDGATSARLATLFGGNASSHRILAAAFSPDGKIVATADSEGEVRFRDSHSGRLLGRSPHQNVSRIVFSPDSGRAISLGSDERPRLWSPRDGRSIATLSGHRGGVWSAVFSPDGTIVATSSEDATIRLWDAATGRVLAVLEGHRAGVSSVAFHPYGKILLSVSTDGARVWDVSMFSETIDQMSAVIARRVGRPLSEEEREESRLPPEKKTPHLARVDR